MTAEKFTLEKAKRAARIAIDPDRTTLQRLEAIARINVASDDGIYWCAIRTPTSQYVMPKGMFNILCIVKAKYGLTEAVKTMANWFEITQADAAIIADDNAFPPWRRRSERAGSE